MATQLSFAMVLLDKLQDYHHKYHQVKCQHGGGLEDNMGHITVSELTTNSSIYQFILESN